MKSLNLSPELSTLLCGSHHTVSTLCHPAPRERHGIQAVGCGEKNAAKRPRGLGWGGVWDGAQLCHSHETSLLSASVSPLVEVRDKSLKLLRFLLPQTSLLLAPSKGALGPQGKPREPALLRPVGTEAPRGQLRALAPRISGS